MRKRFLSRNRVVLFAAFAFAFTAAFAFLAMKNQAETSAASLAGWDAGDIISDGVMSNYNSMSESQIQSFLKSKNSCNDTRLYLVGNKTGSLDMSGTMNWHVSGGHFVCMADESFNGESAAHIIWQAAQDYKINPQVLIVLLQKEQGLVTDTLPRSGQYRAATGYGCPDTAPCDSEYYGFKNQVRKAASLFRTVLNGGWTNYPVGNNYIQYSPNGACGGSIVNVKNRATSSLYRYTPYQPNAGALAAGYGTASCGAYGNRNFYLYFTDWFGDTHRSWESMSDPRYMQLKQTANRIYPYSLEVYDTLEKGKAIKFVSKTTAIDGNVCLRTEHNTIYGINACVRMKDLENIPLNYENVPANEQSKIINVGAKKTALRSLDDTLGFGAKTIRKFVKKVTLFNGKTYYITEYDAALGSAAGISEEYLSNGYESISPIERILVNQTDRINPLTGSRYDTLGKGRVLTFTSRIQLNGKWYYRTAHNTTYGIDAVVPEAALAEVPSYEPFVNPRELKLSKDANRINPITGAYYDTLAKDRVLKFTSKIFVNGEWYYRTEHNTINNINAALPASVLVSVE